MNKRTSFFQLIVFKGCFIYGLFIAPVSAQQNMPEILNTGTIRQQFDYLEGRTRIYNNYRAIREDMFQQIYSNTIDSLDATKNIVLQLKGQLREQEDQTAALQEDLQDTRDDLKIAVNNRDSFFIFGMAVHKILYNTILWAVIAALAFLLVIIFLMNKRNLITARQNRRDLEETREEFDSFRKAALRKQEQLVVKHHNEIRKLKG